MKLSQDIVFYQIRHRIGAKYICKTADLRVGRPVFYEEDRQSLKCIVIIDAKKMVRIAGQSPSPFDANLFICIGASDQGLNIPGCSIVNVEQDISLHFLFNLLQDIYNWFDQWDETLQSVCQNGGNFQDLINCTEPLMFDPFSLVDNSFSYVAYCKRSLKKGLVDKYVDSRGNIPLDVVNKLLIRNSYSEQCKRTGIFPFSIGDDHFIYNNLFYKGKFIGRFGIHIDERGKDVSLYYKSILEYLSRATIRLYGIHGSFNQKESIRNSLRMLLLSSLEHRKDIPSEKWEQVVEENGWFKSDRYVLIQFLPNPRYDKNIYADHLSTEIERRWQGCICFEYKSRLLMLVNTDRFYSNEDDLPFRQALAYFLRESLLVAGISRKFSGLSDISPAYKQTETAIEIGVVETPTCWAFHFDDYAFRYMLIKSMERFEPEDICNEKLLRLRDHDRQKKTEYCKTLRTYISCRFNASDAAKKLFVHRSSFLNRMDRIQKLAAIDFNKDDEWLYIALSFKIMEEKDLLFS